jgi:tetratricopeptide (TPR) repeat protein
MVRIQRKFDKKTDMYNLLLEANTAFPENIAFAGDLALLSAGMKKYAEADGIFRNYCLNKVVPEEFIYHAIRFYLNSGRKPMADSICRHYDELLQGSEDRKFKRASLWTNDPLIRQNYEFYVNELIKNEIDNSKNSLHWITLKANVLVANGKEKEAIDLLESTIDSGFYSEELFSQLLYLLNSKSDKRLERHAGEAVRLFPDQQGFRILYGLGLMINGNYNEMVSEFEEILEGELENSIKIQTLIFLGEGYRKLGKMELSDATFDSALVYNQTNDLVLNNYSYYLAERGEKLDKADRMSSELLKINSINPTYLDTRGWVLYKMGKARKSRRILEKAITNGGITNWVIIEHLGDVWYSLGRERKAFECWKKVAELNGKVYNVEDQVERVKSDLKRKTN